MLQELRKKLLVTFPKEKAAKRDVRLCKSKSRFTKLEDKKSGF
jgi:hypothetical protein